MGVIFCFIPYAFHSPAFLNYKFTTITGISINSIMILGFILGLFIIKWKYVDTIGIVLFLINLLLPTITLITHIFLIIFKKKTSSKIKKVFYIIILIIDLISSLLAMFYIVFFEKLDKDEEKYNLSKGWVYAIYTLFNIMIIGIHFYCFISLLLIEKKKKNKTNHPTIPISLSSININQEKKIIFKGEKNLEGEILINENDTVEKLLFEYIKKFEAEIGYKKTYFFHNQNKINISEKKTIKEYFGISSIILVKVKDKVNTKKFNFNGIYQLNAEISVCIYETIEQLLFEYFEKIKEKNNNILIDNIVCESQGINLKLHKEKLIEDFFYNLISEDYINIIVYYGNN